MADKHPESITYLGWWTISGANLMELLYRAHQGEDPELIYAEEYANAEHHEVTGP